MRLQLEQRVMIIRTEDFHHLAIGAVVKLSRRHHTVDVQTNMQRLFVGPTVWAAGRRYVRVWQISHQAQPKPNMFQSPEVFGRDYQTFRCYASPLRSFVAPTRKDRVHPVAKGI